MYGERSLLREGFATLVANVRSVSRVRPQVRFQRGLQSKSLPALFALYGFEPRVHYQVVAKTGLGI